MVLGGLDTNNKIGVSENDFDFSVLNNDIQQIKQQQKYILIGLAILLIILLTKK